MKEKGITYSTIGLMLLVTGIAAYYITYVSGIILETKPYLLLIMSILYLLAVYDVGFTKKHDKTKNKTTNKNN